jgi:hypothetical protein
VVVPLALMLEAKVSKLPGGSNEISRLLSGRSFCFHGFVRRLGGRNRIVRSAGGERDGAS